MLDEAQARPVDRTHGEPAVGTPDPAVGAPGPADPHLNDRSPEPQFEEGLTDEVSNLIDDGVSYAQAELAFQKTRAALAGKSLGIAAAAAIVALVVLNIALIALAVGLIMALEPLVTIWGAIAIVVGLLLVITVLLALKAKHSASRASALFSGNDEASS